MVAVPLGACDVIQDGGHLGPHLGFYPKLEIMEETEKKIENAGHEEYDVIKYFATFCKYFLLFSPKKGKKTRIFLQK